jgi:hypothetical protein
MLVEGKREREVSISRMIDKRYQHTVGVTLTLGCFATVSRQIFSQRLSLRISSTEGFVVGCLPFESW